MTNGRRDRPRRGILAGFMLKLARTSIPSSQEDLGVVLGVSRNTIQGWESGRRALTAVSHGDAVALQQRMLHLGARPALISAMTDAYEADVLMGAVLDMPPATVQLERHPLGWTVLSHAVVEMMLWAAAGHTPRLCAELRASRRHGPETERPELDPGDDVRFFTHLRVLAERARDRDAHLLLHRQATFLASTNLGAADWVRPSRRALDHLTGSRGWSPYWADARSHAIALARAGDPEPLSAFLARAADDDEWNQANLAYWAYWCGDLATPQPNDLFMVDRSLRWDGRRLYAHLTTRIDPASSRVNLNVHSLWALIHRQRNMARQDPASTARLLGRVDELLDSDAVTTQAKVQLSSLRYTLTSDD